MQKQIYFGIFLTSITLTLSQCSSAPATPESKDQTTFSAISNEPAANEPAVNETTMIDDLPGEPKESETPEEVTSTDPPHSGEVVELKNKIQQLESQVSGLLEKVKNSEQAYAKLKSEKEEPASSPIKEPMIDQVSKIPSNKPERLDQKEAIESFRTAMLFFKGQKYSSAILGFTQFVNKHADHVLSGSAQFHVGESYLAQNELKLAVEEYKRVLVSYEKSNVVPEVLLRLTTVNASLGNTEDSERYKQQLLSLFPHSPAASKLEQQNKDIINEVQTNEDDIGQYELDDIETINAKVQKANEILEKSRQLTQQDEPPTVAIPE